MTYAAACRLPATLPVPKQEFDGALGRVIGSKVVEYYVSYA